MAEVKFYEHPYYEEKKLLWETVRDLYQGNPKVLKNVKYLWPHELEYSSPTIEVPQARAANIADADRIRGIREMRTVYSNELEPVVSRYMSIFFREEPEVDKATEDLFGDDIHDVTGNGRSLMTFIKEDVFSARVLYGRPMILTDAPPDELKNQAQQKLMRPVFELLHPLSVKDWEMERMNALHKGEFKWLAHDYELIAPRSGATDSPNCIGYVREMKFVPNPSGDLGTYIINIYKEDFDDRTKKASWVLDQTYTLPGYPNLPVRSIEDEESWLKDAAPLALKLYNLESGLDNVHYYQGYQRIFVAGNMTQENKIAMGEYTISFIPEGSVVHTVTPGDTSAIENNIRETRMAIRLAAFNQTRMTAVNSAQVESDATQREQKETISTFIKSEIETFESLVNKAVKDYAFFKTGKTDFQGKITFCRDVDVDNVLEEIQSYQMLRDDINKFPTWKKEVLLKFLDSMDLPNKEAIEKEIEATNLEEVQPGQNDLVTRVFGNLNGQSRRPQAASEAASES